MHPAMCTTTSASTWTPSPHGRPPPRGKIVGLVGINNVDQVVFHPRQLLGIGLRRAHVHVAVHLPRIGADYLGVEFFGQGNGDLGLSSGRRPGDQQYAVGQPQVDRCPVGQRT